MLMDKALIASFSGKPMLKKIKKIVLDHYSTYIYLYNYYLSIIYPRDSQSYAQWRIRYATKIIQIIDSFPDFNEFKLRKKCPRNSEFSERRPTTVDTSNITFR